MASNLSPCMGASTGQYSSEGHYAQARIGLWVCYGCLSALSRDWLKFKRMRSDNSEWRN